MRIRNKRCRGHALRPVEIESFKGVKSSSDVKAAVYPNNRASKITSMISGKCIRLTLNMRRAVC